MITIMNIDYESSAVALFGLSTDQKPTSAIDDGIGKRKISNGSTFECIDTGEIYTFDEEGSRWILTQQSGYPEPKGSVTINENGTHNVKDVATAIVDVPEPKGSITINKNGTHNVKDVATAVVDVAAGDVTAEKNDVTFYDYNGAIRYSYTAQEFQAHTQLPDNPDHTDKGLTATGWNWPLQDAKSFVASHGSLDIGQTYEPTDGKAHIFVELLSGYLSPVISFVLNGSAVIEWGDGSSSNVTTASAEEISETHTYVSAGKYEIKITIQGTAYLSHTPYEDDNGSCLFWGGGNYLSGVDRIYRHCVKKVYLGPLGFMIAASSNDEEDGEYDSQDENETPDSSSGLAYLDDLEEVVLPGNVTTIPDQLMYFSNTNTVVIPYGVNVLGARSFASGEILHVILPSSISELKMYQLGIKRMKRAYIHDSVRLKLGMFSGANSLEEYTFPEGVTAIPYEMFYDCGLLREINIPDTIGSISTGAFRGCTSLTSIMVPDSVYEIFEYAFSDCSMLNHVTLPSGLTGISSELFCNDKYLTSLNIPQGVTSIGESAFESSGLQVIDLPEGLESIGQAAFAYCPLEKIAIPSQVLELPPNAFESCESLEYVDILGDIKSIGGQCFQGCLSLTSFTIPASVAYIDYDAFAGCASLSEVHVLASVPPQLDWGVFSECDENLVIYVPSGSLADYQAATNWDQLNLVEE